MFALSLLEIFSTLFQSITLSNRLTINVLAGGLLLTLISVLFKTTIIFVFLFNTSVFFILHYLALIIILIIFIGFYLFELFVLIVQTNIFIILINVYSSYVHRPSSKSLDLKCRHERMHKNFLTRFYYIVCRNGFSPFHAVKVVNESGGLLYFRFCSYEQMEHIKRIFGRTDIIT